MLLPFVAGMAVAYLLDPLCDRLQRWGLSRTCATALVTVFFVLFCVLVLLLIIPTLLNQIATSVERAPEYPAALQQEAHALLVRPRARLDPTSAQNLHGQDKETTHK